MNNDAFNVITISNDNIYKGRADIPTNVESLPPNDFGLSSRNKLMDEGFRILTT
jgi:hypothetical protein